MTQERNKTSAIPNKAMKNTNILIMAFTPSLNGVRIEVAPSGGIATGSFHRKIPEFPPGSDTQVCSLKNFGARPSERLRRGVGAIGQAVTDRVTYLLANWLHHSNSPRNATRLDSCLAVEKQHTSAALNCYDERTGA